MIIFNTSERISEYRLEQNLEIACQKIRADVAVEKYLTTREAPKLDKVVDFIRKSGLRVMHLVVTEAANFRVLCGGRGVILNLEVRANYADFAAYARNLKTGQAALDRVEKFFAEYLIKSKNKRIIPVDFWHWNGRNSAMMTRLIECPTWDEISTNYVPEAAAEMARVMAIQKPEETGKVMLWHGEPGTGKTYAVRALLQAWKDGYRPTVIVDPEVLFTNSGYLYDVLFDERYMYQPDEDDADLLKSGSSSKKKEILGKILVLEDMPDLLLKSSRNDKNHAMARLLNLSDGILGQGVKAVFLFTTNQELDEIDPAFTRPGRCLATVKFEKFGPKAATEWLRAKKAEVAYDYDMTSNMTIAEMYALFHKKSPLGSPGDLKPKKIVGFAVDNK